MDALTRAKASADFLADLRELAPRLKQRQRGQVSGSDLALDRLVSLGEKLQAARILAQTGARDAVERHVKEVRDSPLLGKVSLFRSIGMCRQEKVHTKSLAWLLDPHESHDFGNAGFLALLKAALRRGTQQDDWKRLADTQTRLEWVTPEYNLSPSCRVDLFLKGALSDGQPWVMLIEAKVGAQERRAQLSDYDAALRKHLGSRAGDVLALRVFLTEQGRDARTAREDAWTSLGFKDLARELMRSYAQLEGKAGHPLLRIYLTGVLEDICGITCSADVETLVSHNDWSDLEHLLEIGNE